MSIFSRQHQVPPEIIMVQGAGGSNESAAGDGTGGVRTDLPLKKALEFPILSNISTSCMDLV